MDISALFFKYKKIILILAINIIGILAIFAAVWIIRVIAAGPIPNPEQATEKAVVNFLADKKMGILPKYNRRKYFKKVIEHYSASPERQEQFRKAITKLSDYQIRQLKDNVFDVAREQVVEDAKEYSRLANYQQRKAFIDQRLSKLKSLEAMIKGNSDQHGSSGHLHKTARNKNAGRTNLTKDPRLRKGLPTSPGGIYKKFVEKTKPADRARLETFIGDVQSRSQQLRKLRKSRMK